MVAHLQELEWNIFWMTYRQEKSYEEEETSQMLYHIIYTTEHC